MNRRPVKRARKSCNRCGSSDVSWRLSGKTAKWYLVEVFQDAEGNSIASDRDFHSRYCGKPEEHRLLQAKLDLDYAEDRDDFADISEIKDEVELIKAFIALSAPSRNQYLAELKFQLNGDWKPREKKRRQDQIDLLESWNDDLEDE